MLKLILIAFCFMLVAVSFLALRLFFVKDAHARGTCSSHNPLLAAQGIDQCSSCPNKDKADCPATKELDFSKN